MGNLFKKLFIFLENKWFDFELTSSDILLSKVKGLVMNLTITQVSEKYNITPDTLRYFELGKFKIVGPFKDIENSGVILAQVENREEMEKIISEDYELHEFDPKLIAKDIKLL